MEIMQAPALEIDKVLYGKAAVPPRQKLERRIVWNLLHRLKAVGFNAVAVFDGEEKEAVAVFDGEEKEAVKDETAAMELIFNLDDCHVHVRKDGGKAHWFMLVLGNGCDVLSDYGIPKEDDGFQALMDAFDGEEFA